MTPIEDAINIGPTLAAELRQAGIESLEQLREMGYLQAWQRLRAVAAQRTCANSCLALAGAVEGVRWMKLPAEVRGRIGEEVRKLNGETGG